MNKAITAVKDGYLKVVQWVDDNPQKSIWSALAVMLVLLVF